ncbi:hypothetical protein Acidovoranil_04180 [Acidovorax sp. FG27]
MVDDDFKEEVMHARTDGDLVAQQDWPELRLATGVYRGAEKELNQDPSGIDGQCPRIPLEGRSFGNSRICRRIVCKGLIHRVSQRVQDSAPS